MGRRDKKLYLITFVIFWGVIIGFPTRVNANGVPEPPFSEFIQANENFNYTYSFDFPFPPIPKFFVFNLSTNVNTTLNLNFNNTIPFSANKQVSILINNNNTEESLGINITAIFNAEEFFDGLPQNPTYQDIALGFQYNSFYKIQSNITISEVSFKFLKDDDYGFDDKNYSIGYYKGEISNTPELILTSEVEGDEINYIKGTIQNFEGEEEYYVSIFEIEETPVTPPDFNWFWLLIPIGLGFISLIIVLSKKEYFKQIKRRTTPIDKGAHRLDMDEVLENENRSKIIDLILEQPGIHFNELLRKTDLAPGNLVWHLDILETYKVIKKKRVGNYVMFIPYYNKNPLSNIDLKLQKSELTLQILESIEEDPGIWNSKLTDKMQIHRKTIQYHIDKLIDLGLVFRKKDGSKKKIYPNLQADYYEDKAIKD